MYYRIYKFYYKWDKETGITAVIAVSMFGNVSKLVMNNFYIINFLKIS